MAQAIEYSGPKLTHEVDVERYLRDCPPHATTRGTFFKYVREAVEKKVGARRRSTDDPSSCATVLRVGSRASGASHPESLVGAAG